MGFLLIIQIILINVSVILRILTTENIMNSERQKD